MVRDVVSPADRSLDFFISYSPADERWAAWIAGTLEAAGYRTMLQAWDFVPGTNFIDFMDRGVSESTVVIAVLSRNYLQSRYGRVEWQAALRAAPDNPEAKLLPVRVEDTPLHGLLATITYVDLVGVDDADLARGRLLARVREALSGRAKPTERPAYPGSDPVIGAPATGGQPAASLPVAGGAQRHDRPMAVTAPVYPSAAPPDTRRSDITILHVAGPCFGRSTVASDRPIDAAGLQSHIFGEVTQLIHDGAPAPDLLVVTGDLTATGGRSGTESALLFLTRLRVRLGLEPNRLVVVPGGLDVNRPACRAYFNECEADDLQPTPPYWPKWRHFTRLFQELYQGLDDIGFERGQPWSLFTLADLRVVVAGINTSMAISHRAEDDYGLVDLDQAAWFASRLRAYADAGWLRIGVLRHAPISGELRDASNFARRVAPHLNLVVHGPGPEGSGLHTVGADLTCLSVPQPGDFQLISLTAEGLTRWTEESDGAAGEPTRVAQAWRAAGETFAADPVLAGSSGAPADTTDATPEVREVADPIHDLLDRLEEVCHARYERVRVRRVRSRPPYLVVTYAEDGFARELCLGAHLGEPGPADVDAFRQLVRAADPDLALELVYQGPPPPRDLPEQARRAGVRLRSFTEFQGLLDLRSYVAAQTNRLSVDRQYPPHLYVPQRFRQLDRPDEPVRDGLAEELLRQLAHDQGRFILLLGDFGRGKTFALREVAQRIPVELPHLTPILIELRALDKAHSIEGLVAAHLADHDETNIDLRAFRYLLNQGRIVLLFDGFDELVTRTTYERAADHLDTLLSAATDRAKIMVASRTQHFQSHTQVLTALGERVGLLPQRRVLSIEEFTPAQIRAYLVNHYRGDEQAADARLRLIRGVPNLIELSHNPRLLSFVADLAEERLYAVARVGHGLSAAGLYREILSAWLDVEERRTRGIPGAPSGLRVDDLWRAVTSLALRLWETNETVLRLTDLAEVAETLSGMVEGQLSTEQAAHALGTGTVLVRDDEGLFGFIHGSVIEWLVANEIAARLAEGVTGLLSRRALSQLSVDFLCDLADVRALGEWATRVLSDTLVDEVARGNARKVSARLRIPASADLRGAALQGEDLSYRDLTGCDLTGADLTDARLIGADLSGATLREARLVGARLDEAVLTGADLTGADLTRARLTGADLRRVTVTGSRWRRAAVIAATTDPGLSAAPELRGAAVAPGRPVETQLAPVAVGVPYGFHIRFGRLPQPLAYNRAGDILAIGCDNGAVVICDSLSGLPLRTLSGHHGRVYAVASGPDDWLVTAASDGTIRMWDSGTGALRWVRADYRDWVWPIAFDGRGGVVAASDGTGTLQLMDAATGDLRHALPGATAPVWTIAFSPDDARVACGGSDGVVRLWHVESGRLEHEFAGHTGAVYRICFAAGIDALVTADSSGILRVWDVQTGQLRHRLTGHTRAVYAVDVHPGGKLLASADTGGRIRLWSLPDGRPAAVLDSHTTAVYQVLFSPDGHLLASGDSGGMVRLWMVTPEAEVVAQVQAELTGHRAGVWPGVFRPDSAQFATTSTDGTARLWEVPTGHGRHVLRGHGRRITSVTFSADGAVLAACGNDGVVRLWDPATGQQVRQLTGVADQLVSAVFSPTGRTVAAASNDGGVYLFNAETGAAERELDVDTTNVWAEAFSPDGAMLATANDDDSVRLWFHHTGAQGHTLSEHRGRVRSIEFAPDSTALATGCDDRKVRLWDATTGACLSTLDGHTDRVYAVAFSPDGALLASAGWDGEVRLWHPGRGTLLHTLTGRRGRVWTADFHPSGELLASAGDDAVIDVWHPRTGQRLHTLEGHIGRIFAVSFSPDGGLLASAGDDGTVRLWDFRQPDQPRLRLTLLGQRQGWAALGNDGGYKVSGGLTGVFWHVVNACRFEPGELDGHLAEVRRMPLDAPFA